MDELMEITDGLQQMTLESPEVMMMTGITEAMSEHQQALLNVTQYIPDILKVNNPTRQYNIHVYSYFCKRFPLSILTETEIAYFKHELKSHLFNNLEIIRQNEQSSWPQLWFLLREYLSGHLDADIISALLEPFTKPEVYSYKFWTDIMKRLKEEYSLINFNWYSSENLGYIKMVITLLIEAPFDNDALESKRLLVWMMLFKELREFPKVVFFDFVTCYFSMDVPERSETNWKISTEILLAILGHDNFCNDKNHWQAAKHGIFPVITLQNIEEFSQFTKRHVLYAVTKWYGNEERNQFVMCFYKTVANLIINKP